MEEIKVNEYVRTTNKGIKRIDNIDNNKTVNKYLYYIGEDWDGKCYGIIKTTEIVKHSFDIKELVQAGDIILYTVNSKMTDIEIVKEHIDARTQKKTLRVGLWSLEQVEIKEILTKEQCNQMKYIVGDE